MTFTTAILTPDEASSESCMTPSGTRPREARRLTTLLTMKGRPRIKIWNVRTLCEAGNSAQVASGMRQKISQCKPSAKADGMVQVKLHFQLESGYSTLDMNKNSKHRRKEWYLMLSEPSKKVLVIEWSPV